jgi:DNA-3-methyladenine glycosylase
MFGPAGHAYVYATQGRCHCLNVTAEGNGNGRAVLLRALEPVAGVPVMRRRRLARLDDGPTRRRLVSGADHELARGPGRLCLCLDVDRRLDGVDLTDGDGPVYLAAPPEGDARRAGPVLWTSRVGLNPASASSHWRWRALLADSRAVSPGRDGAARRPRPSRCPPARCAPPA